MDVIIIPEKRDNETALDYHKRLVYGKLVDKSLSDVDYSELAEVIYGKPYASDVARRMMYGSCRTLEIVEADRLSGVGDTDIRAEIDVKIKELQKERQRFFDQRREYKKLISAEGRADHLHDMIREAANRLAEDVGELFPVDYQGVLGSDNEAVLVLSDWHYGLKVSNIFNTYNTEICRERVRTAIERAIERIDLHQCNKVHVVVLGDLFHGAIHTSVRVASEEYACEQLMHVSEILAQAIYELTKHTEEVVVYMTYGNHARTVQNKKDSAHGDNMEKIINWWMIERFKDNPSVKIMPVPENEFINFEVCGHAFCATHGDLDSVSGSGRLLATLFQKKYGVDLEYVLLGDKHHRESFNELGITSMLCGSLCGADDYANDKRLYSEPSQMLLIVNPECGVDAEYRIKC